MLYVILIPLAAIAGAIVGARVTQKRAMAEMCEHLKKEMPDGPPNRPQTLGGNCYWHCVTLYWYGIPYGTQCTYYCDSGGGPQ